MAEARRSRLVLDDARAALGTHGHENGIEAEIIEVIDGQYFVSSDGDVAPIMDAIGVQNLGELFPQTRLHFVFIVKDTVLCEATGSNIAIQNDHFETTSAEFSRGVHSCGASPDDGDRSILVIHRRAQSRLYAQISRYCVVGFLVGFRES